MIYFPPMKAIIPAAGLGTRFLPVTKVVPKEMLPIGSRPALALIVEEARSAGAEEIVIVISPGKELIREYFKDDPSIKFAYQMEQKGLGHAVMVGLEESKDGYASARPVWCESDPIYRTAALRTTGASSEQGRAA